MQEAVLGIIVGRHMTLMGERLVGDTEVGLLHAPGGIVEKDETLFEALERQLAEQLCIGIDERDTAYFGTLVLYADGKPYMRVYLYQVYKIYGEPSKTEYMRPEYVTISFTPFNRMSEAYGRWFGRTVQGVHFNANIYYHTPDKDFERIEFLPFDGNPKRLSP